MRAPRVCSTPGCPTLIPTGGRCPDCAAAADARRPTSRQRGYDTRWERTRHRQLRAHPDCDWCGAPATVVDHVDGLGPRSPRGHDPTNLRSMCASCHGRRTANDQPGGWNV